MQVLDVLARTKKWDDTIVVLAGANDGPHIERGLAVGAARAPMKA
jgi:hypothetical protein